MRVKKVNRYYCDYCKKASCSGAAISKHEKHCTLNPNRECGVCKAAENDQAPVIEMLKLLPDANRYRKQDSNSGLEYLSDDLIGATNAALKSLREVSGNCPVCIMAALRQAGIPVVMATDFDYRKELDELWSDVNSARAEKDLGWEYYR